MATIFRPQLLYPSNISLDMSVDQTFTCVVEGQRITGYEINIYDNSDSSLVYSDSETFTSENYLYNKDTLSVIIPDTSGCTNGNEYKWSLTYSNGSESVTSQEKLFYAAESASFTISIPATIEAQGYTFDGTYSQPDGVGVRYWYYELYDEDDGLLQRSRKVYSSNISLLVNGFLDGYTYKIKGFLETKQGIQISTDTYEFLVDYTPGELQIVLQTVYDETRTAPHFLIPKGEVEGDYSYYPDLFENDNYGIELDTEAILYYDLSTTLGDDFTVYLDVIITTEFSGDIIKILNTTTGEYYLVGYDDTLEQFYFDVDGTITYSEELYAVSQKVYLVVITPTDMDVSEYVWKDAQFLTSDEKEFFDVDNNFFFVQYVE